MALSPWFRSFRRLFQAATARRSVIKSRIRPIYRPAVEVLEDRRCPSVAFVQNLGTAGSTANITSLAITNSDTPVTAGDAIIVEVSVAIDGSSRPTSVTDGAGNTYSSDGSVGEGGADTYIFSAFNVVALSAGGTITVNFSGATGAGNCEAASASEFSGVGALDQITQTNGVGTNTSPATGLTGTTAQANELLIGAIGVYNPVGSPPTFTPGAGYTALPSASALGDGNTAVIFPEYQIVSTTGTYQADGTLSSAPDDGIWEAAIATFDVPVPTVTNVSPSSGTPAGGTTVTITGTSFTGASAVDFDTSPAESFTVNSATSITATSPAGSGTEDIKVTTPNGTSTTSAADHFTYISAPTISNVGPSSGPDTGGTSITITGTQFASGATVEVGGTLATNVDVVSATEITATTPAGTAGAAAVVVTNSDTGTVTDADGFTYISVPTISNVSPGCGPDTGGTPITITGTQFANGATVEVGGTLATNIDVVSATEITATTPAGTAGAADVVVTNSDTGTTTDTGGFTYISVPTISNVGPSSGPDTGGTSITITGTQFASGATVEVGGTLATNVDVVSATEITATTPAGTAGAAAVVVTNSDTGTVTDTGGFTYISVPTISNVSPSSGPDTAGTSITITGTQFASGATVTVGGTLATNIDVVSATEITANTPAGTAGAAAVVVTNSDTGTTTDTGGFTYISVPTISNVGPSSGPATGGTSITVTGTQFASGATVTVGGALATNVDVVSATEITATTPANTAGAAAVVVTNSDTGTATDTGGFTYDPVVTPASPLLTIATSTTLTIDGFGFDSNPAHDHVIFSGGVTGTVSAASATTLTVTGLMGLNVGPLLATVTVNDAVSNQVHVATVSSAVVIDDNTPGDTLTLMQTTGTGTVGDITYVLGNQAPVTLTGVTSFTFNGTGGNDTMIVEFPTSTAGVLLSGTVAFNTIPQAPSTLTIAANGLPVQSQPGSVVVGNLQRLTYTNVTTTTLNNAGSVNTITGPDTANRTTAFVGLTTQQRFVQALYLDELGRAGSVSELNGWVAVLDASSAAVVAGDIAHSAEATDHLVKTWYQTFLGRPASNGEELGFVNALMDGASAEVVLGYILGSTEFFDHAQTLIASGTAQQRYVQALYQLLLGRTGGAAEVAGWVGELPQMGDFGTALNIVESQECRTDLIEGYYNSLLHRPADQTSLHNWVFSNEDALTLRIGIEVSAEFFTNG